MDRIKSFFYYVFVYSMPALVILLYVGLYLGGKYDVFAIFEDWAGDLMNNAPLIIRFPEELFDKSADLFGAVGILIFVLWLPLLAIILLGLAIWLVLFLLSAIVNYTLGLLLFFIGFVLVLIIQVIVPGAAAVFAVIYLVRKRVDADDEVILQTILCTLSVIISAVACVMYYILAFSGFPL